MSDDVAPSDGLSSTDDYDSITYKSNTTESAMRITTKGQVTIPLQIRERLGLLPNTEVDFAIRGNTVVLTKASGKSRGRRIVDALRGAGTAQAHMSTDEILAMMRGGDDPVLRGKR